MRITLLNAMRIFLLVVLSIPLASFAQTGTMWGNTLLGGTDNLGVIFKTNADGTGLSVEQQFVYTTTIKAAGPQNQPVLGTDGNFYSLATFGGSQDWGVLFKFDPTTSTFTQLHDFGSVANDGHNPISSVMQASNGKLYGMTQFGGTNDNGILFEYDPSNGNYAIKHTFGLTALDGSTPSGNMIEAANGKLYGMTSFSGNAGTGVIFEYDPATSTYAVKLELNSAAEGSAPYGDLVLHSNGKFYGMTQATLNSGFGSIFEYVPGATSVTVKAVLDATTGGNTWGSLTEAANNKLYGLTYYGGANNTGTIIEFDPTTSALTKKIDFDVSKGQSPYGSLALSPTGTLFGTTSLGGANGLGTLFEFDPTNGAFTKKIDLDLSTGTPLYGKPLFKPNGKLYGLSNNGGINNTGVLYEYDPGSNAFTGMLSFGAATNGKAPSNAMTQALNGKFYGPTGDGGTMGYGTIYELDPSNSNFTKKADFTGQNGRYSNTAMLLASNGKLYGIAQIGGASNAGAIYEFDPATGSLTKKLDLDRPTTGTSSFAGFVEASNGKLYGVLNLGGSDDHGTLIEYDVSANILTVKHNFDQTTEYSPTSAPIVGPNGKLYGVTNNSNPLGGALYEYDPITSIYTKKKNFATGGATARSPRGSMTLANNGKMYGLTLSGGANGGGAIYEYDPASNTLTDKYSFPFVTPNGFGLFGTMTLSTTGKLYGMTFFGGTSNLGFFFEYDPATSTFTKVFDFDRTNGANPQRTSLTVQKNTQTITFNALANKTYGDAAFQPGATASSGLTVVYSSSNPAVATVSGNTVTITGAGTTTLTARQLGNPGYLTALAVSANLTVSKAPQTITFNTIPTKTFGDSSFDPAVSVSSGLGYTLSSTSDKISINGTTVTMLKAGRLTIKADNSGTANYLAAPTASQNFCINPPKPSINLSSINGPTPLLTSSALSTYQIQWFLNGSAISGGTSAFFTPTQSGTYKAQFTVDDCVGEFSTDLAVVITGDLPDRVSPVGISLFPNPANDRLTVYLGDDIGKKSIGVYSLTGQLTDAAETSGAEISFNLANYASGLYVVKVISEKANFVSRFSKQ